MLGCRYVSAMEDVSLAGCKERFEFAQLFYTGQGARWGGARGKGKGFFYFLCEGKPFYEPQANVRAGLHSLFKVLVVRLVYGATLNCECNSEGICRMVLVNGLWLARKAKIA